MKQSYLEVIASCIYLYPHFSLNLKYHEQDLLVNELIILLARPSASEASCLSEWMLNGPMHRERCASFHFDKSWFWQSHFTAVFGCDYPILQQCFRWTTPFIKGCLTRRYQIKLKPKRAAKHNFKRRYCYSTMQQSVNNTMWTLEIRNIAGGLYIGWQTNTPGNYSAV